MELVVAEELFAGGGEMAALMRSLDWSQTLLGSVSQWAQSLKTAVSIILTSRYPMFIWWGAEYANLYNDAYRPLLGATKHPQFLGQSAKDCWADVWDLVGPLADSVLTTGQPTWSEDLLLLMDRNGYLEETYFTFSYSPVRDDSGGVGGVLCTVTETTGRIIGERRLRTLRELAAKTAEAKTVEETCHIATTTLAINPHDIAFALLYRVEPDGKQARLAGTTGIEAGTVATPELVDLFQESEADRWNLARVNRTGKAELVSDLPTKFIVLPKGAWSEEPTEALVIPIAQSGKAQQRGLLVVGISPRREFDDDYQGFFDLIASNVATAIANADAVEEASRCLPEEGSGEWGIGNGEERFAPTPYSGAGTGALPLLPTPSPARILLVDDNADMRDYVRRLLSRDYEVEAVSDRLAALDAIQQHPPDLVLTDVMISGLDGIDLLRSLRNDPATQNIPIILLSAPAGEESWIEGLQAGADDYLIKPFSARELLARVRTNLELARLRREAVRYQEQLRVEAQAALREQRTLLETILRQAADAIIVCDATGKLTFVNTEARRLAQQDPDSTTVDLNLLDWGTAYDTDGNLIPLESYAISKALRGEVSNAFEARMVRQDGSYYDILVSAAPLWNENQQIIGAVGIFIDISERQAALRDRQQAEEALRESEQRFRRIFECNMIGMGVWTRSGGIIQANDALLNLIGYTRQELDAGLISWQELTPPEQLYLDARSLAQIHTTGVIAPYEKEYIHKTGRRVPILVGGASFSGTADSGIFFAIDLTERKQAEEVLRQSEERLRLAMEGAQMGTWDVDLNTGKAIWSDQHFTMLGYEPTPTGEASEAIWYSRIYPEDRERVTQEWQQSRQEHRLYRAEYRVVRADTQQIAWLAALGSFVYNQDGEAIRSIGVLFDITDRKQAELEIRKFVSLADNSTEFIGMCDMNFVPFYVNEAGRQMVGLDHTRQYSETPVREFFFPEDQDFIVNEFFPCVLCSGRAEVEIRFRHFKTGKALWMIYNVFYIRDENDQPIGLATVSRNITDRKLAEAEVQRREREFRAVVENTPDLIIRYDRSGRHLYVNPSLERALGIPSEQFIGKTALEMGFTNATSQAWDAVLQQVFLTAQDSTFEFEFPNPEGDRRSYQAYFVPELVQDGEVKTVLAVVRDVTEYKRAQEALRQSEERYRLALQAARMTTWSWDAKTDIIVRSQTACDVMGLPAEALQGKGFQGWQLVHPDDLAQHQATVQAAIDSKGSYISEFRMIRPDNGSVIWLEDRGKVNVDAMGHLISIEGTLFDISDAYRQAAQRKQAQQELQQTLQTLSTLINASPLPIVVIKPNMTVQLWNPAAEQLFGWSEAEVLGQPIPIVPEEKRDECRQVREAVAKGEVFAGVETYRCKRDGATVIVSISAAPLYNEQGSLNAILLIFQDITERQQAEQALRQSEERYRYLAESIPQLVWTANAEGVLLDVNQRWLDYIGLTLAQARIEGWQAIIHPDDVPILSQNWASAQQNGTYYQAEGRMRRVDGVFRWHLHQAVPLKNERGQVIKWFGTATDIDAQKQLEQQRDRILQREKAAREEAERANRIKDEFLAVLSHELRSPLNPILGWAKLLQSRTLDEQKTKHALATIERNALLQTQLIEDLLDVSRILRGKLVLNATPVSLVSTIEAALETVRLAAEAKGIQIQGVLDPNVGQVMGESARLQQVIWNLLSNAVKFTPSGGTIEIRLEEVGNGESGILAALHPAAPIGNGEITPYSLLPTPYSPTHAQIQVKDTGKGINPDFLPHVFEYFRQEDGTTTRKFGGLGLGLAIVRHLVELHGGTVWAESPGEGLGATFSVRLPLMPLATPTPQDNPAEAPIAHLSGLRILVVDDQPDIRDIVAFILEEAGATVRVAASAPEALNLIEQSLPDVLICDIGMPDMDGYMLMRLLKTLPPEQGGKIPAIALTAYAGEYDQKQALAAGFQQHIAKPVEPDELVRAIAHLVQHSRST